MKKGLLALGALFAICLSMLATDMVVKQKNGEDWKINVDDVEEVVFEETIPEDSTVIDTSETFLKFNILSDSTAEVIRETPNLKQDSYLGHDSIIVPQKIRIDGKIYTVTSIGENAFLGCGGLTNIEIPKSVTNIGTWAFSYCSNLEPKLLVYDKGTKCYGWIGDKEKCTEVVIPESVTSIGEKAFFECDNLTSIIIPESVISIGSLAFDRCNNLEPKLLVYDKGTKCYGWIGDEEKCTEVMIPESVTSIGEKAFYFCSSLTGINIPEGVTSIGASAFYYCSSLDVVIDNSKDNVKVGKDAFYRCKSVTWLKE